MLRQFDYENMPVADLVNEIIIDAVKRGASDIHCDPRVDALIVRIRIDGELVDYTSLPIGIKNHVVTKIKILAGMNITESRLPQDGAIKTTIEQRDLDLRVSTLPTVYGEKVVIRILDYARSMEGLETLGFSDESLTKLNQIIASPNGIVLVTGATGTGKSTTVYAILDRLNTKERNIITVEDPVEMKIEGINQVQAQSEIGLNFATALRSILRQDPDTIMIGEIRDDETARIAVRAAITGHLVLSTIHTNNSLNTIERLLDMDVERYLLGSALVGIVSQRLTKMLCPKCRAARATTDYEKLIFKKALNMDVDSIYEPVGCDECYKGYKGRIAIQEVLAVNQDIRDAILSNLRKDKLREKIYKKGHTISLLQDGLDKVLKGLTSFDEVLRVIEVDSDFGDDEQDIKDALLGKNIDIKTHNQEQQAQQIMQQPTEELVVEDTPTQDTTPVIEQEVTTPIIEQEVTETPVENVDVLQSYTQDQTYGETPIYTDTVETQPVQTYTEQPIEQQYDTTNTYSTDYTANQTFNNIPVNTLDDYQTSDDSGSDNQKVETLDF